MKVFTTTRLRWLIGEARKHHFQQTCTQYRDRLDSLRVHVGHFSFVHNDHIRMKCLIALEGHAEPVEAVLDLEIAEYNKLDDADSFKEQLKGGNTLDDPA